MKEEFPGQKSKEKMIKTLRKNPLSLSRKVLKFIIFLSVSVLLMTYVSQIGFLSFAANYINIFALLGIIFSLSYAFYAWATWYYDVYVLTDERIIEVEQKGLFSREVKEVSLDKIQDVTYSISGLVSTVFNVGTVKVHSASGLTIDMEEISKPSIVREVVVKLMEKKNKGKKGKGLSADEIAEALASRLSVK